MPVPTTDYVANQVVIKVTVTAAVPDSGADVVYQFTMPLTDPNNLYNDEAINATATGVADMLSTQYPGKTVTKTAEYAGASTVTL